MKGRAFSIWTAGGGPRRPRASHPAALPAGPYDLPGGDGALLLRGKVCKARPRRPYREYFRSFKENLLQGIGLSVILALFCAVGFFAATYVVNRPLSEAVDFFYRATFFFACIVVFMILALACPVLSRFRFKTAQVLLFGLRLLVRFPLRTLGLIGVWAALGAGSWFFAPLLLIAPGLGTLLATFLVEPSMQHYMPERSQFDEGTDTWYLE